MQPAAGTTPGSRALAWTAHLLTASGAVLAFLSLQAVVESEYRLAFLWLIAATAVDSVDGWWARRVRVGECLPMIDGARLDDIVDYLTFVFVPAFLLFHAGRLPAAGGGLVVGAILLSSGYGFAQADAKTPDHFFKGFPSYWNIVVFYLYAADTSPWPNAVVLLALSVLVFVPIRYVYPSRMPILQRTTVALGLVWSAMMLVLAWQLPTPSRWLLGLSLFFPAYYGGLSLALHARGTKPQRWTSEKA